MAEHNETGKKGEELAVKYLENKSYKIAALNWRFGNNEIDIIAENKDVLAIVEVKTRTSYFGAEAVTTITKTKQRFLIKAANAYLIKNDIEKEARFDVITVVIIGNNYTIEHIEDAFYPTL